MNPSQIAKMQAARQKPKISKSPIELTEMQRKDLRKVQECYPMALETFRKAFNRVSAKSAIKTMCIQCSNFQRVEVQNCTISGCGLWRYRPYQKKSLTFKEVEKCHP